jgi:hypothetical protein
MDIIQARILVPGLVVIAIVLAGAVAACGGSDDDRPPPGNGPEDGVIATFRAAGEEFSVWVTNEDAIQQLRDLQEGRSEANIPNGRIHRGPGQGGHNAPWSWHLDPEDIEMAEMTMELCDGAPSYVEENVDEFVDVVQRYCPWDAELLAVD